MRNGIDGDYYRCWGAKYEEGYLVYSTSFWALGDNQVSFQYLYEGTRSEDSAWITIHVETKGTLQGPVLSGNMSFSAGQPISFVIEEVKNAAYYSATITNSESEMVESVVANSAGLFQFVPHGLDAGEYTISTQSNNSAYDVGEPSVYHFTVTGIRPEAPTLRAPSETVELNRMKHTYIWLSVDANQEIEKADILYNGYDSGYQEAAVYGTHADVLLKQYQISTFNNPNRYKACVMVNGCWSDWSETFSITAVYAKEDLPAAPDVTLYTEEDGSILLHQDLSGYMYLSENTSYVTANVCYLDDQEQEYNPEDDTFTYVNGRDIVYEYVVVDEINEDRTPPKFTLPPWCFPYAGYYRVVFIAYNSNYEFTRTYLLLKVKENPGRIEAPSVTLLTEYPLINGEVKFRIETHRAEKMVMHIWDEYGEGISASPEPVKIDSTKNAIEYTWMAEEYPGKYFISFAVLKDTGVRRANPSCWSFMRKMMMTGIPASDSMALWKLRAETR